MEGLKEKNVKKSGNTALFLISPNGGSASIMGLGKGTIAGVQVKWGCCYDD